MQRNNYHGSLRTSAKTQDCPGWHRVLTPTANIKVSPIALAGIGLGNAWSKLFGRSEDALLDAYYELGGNIFDIANTYNSPESEKLIGEWMDKKRSAKPNGSCDKVRGRIPCIQSRKRATAK
jgi:hypothetical protein